jgi:hypothetical protein
MKHLGARKGPNVVGNQVNEAKQKPITNKKNFYLALNMTEHIVVSASSAGGNS